MLSFYVRFYWWVLALDPCPTHCRKDVSLPQDMQRSMAAEAEAEREAKAKVRQAADHTHLYWWHYPCCSTLKLKGWCVPLV